MKRKILSLFITALMIVTIMPGNVFAGAETAQQLYWFYNSNDIDVDGDGKIVFDKKEHYEMENIPAEKAKDAIYGYFAYKSGDDSYAVNSAAITDNTNTGGYKLKLYTYGEEGGYEYCLSWTQRGSCSIQATVGETVYEINAAFELPYIGAYSSEAVSEPSYLDGEFHFADSQKDANSAYFYLIQITDEYDSESLKAAASSYTGSGWKTEQVDGIEFGKVEQKTLNDIKCYVSKVTVTKEFRNDRNNGYYYQIGFFETGSDDGNAIGIHSMQIYDSLEYPAEQQMYWVDYGYDIDENGLMNLIEDMPYYDSLDDLAVRVENRSYRSGNMGGCFAVKKDGNYYAVKAESVQHDNNICIEKDDEYVCLVRWTQFGEYTLKYSEGEKQYKFNLVVDLPETGFYSTPARTEAGYIQSELHYIDAIGENDSDAYFYLITPSYGYDINTFSASIDEMTDDYRWIENTVPGISVGQPRYLDESNEYCVWLVTVSKDYRGKTTDWEDKAYNRLQFCITSRVGDEEIYSNAIIDMNVYDSMEVNKDQMMYWFDSECVTINGDKRIVVNDKENYADWCAEEKMFTSDRTYGATYKCGEREGYFAVKIASGEYYAVDNVTVTGGENIKLTSDGNCKYTVTWSDSGDYQFAAEYKGKTYKQNLILHLPNTGFFSSALA